MDDLSDSQETQSSHALKDDYMPEPWEVGFGKPVRPYVVAITAQPKLQLDPKNTITAGTPTGGGPFFGATTTEANARRIVAAVNACAGIPTEILEMIVRGELNLLIITHDEQEEWEGDPRVATPEAVREVLRELQSRRIQEAP